jgi:hypothetical protein
MKKKAVNKKKVLTPAESQRMKRIQAELDSEQDEIIARGRTLLDSHDAMIAALLADLRLAKEKQHLSLNDLQTRTASIERNSAGYSVNPSAQNQRCKHWNGWHPRLARDLCCHCRMTEEWLARNSSYLPRC